MQPGLDGPDGSSDRQADLIIREALFVVEDEDQAIVGSEPSERPVEFAREVVGIGESGSMVDFIDDGLDRDGPSRPPAKRGPASIGSDPEQPRTERSRPIEAGNPAQSTDHRLLGNVLGVVPVPHHPKAEAEDDPVEPLDQLARCERIAVAERPDQIAIVHQSHKGGSPIPTFLRDTSR